jgi:hypothetical protein
VPAVRPLTISQDKSVAVGLEGVFSEVRLKNVGTYVAYISPPPESMLQPLRGSERRRVKAQDSYLPSC